MHLPRFIKKQRKNPKFWFEFAGVCLVVLIFLLKTTSYMRIDELALPNIARTVKAAYISTRDYIGELKYFGSCPEGQLKINVGQQYLCREPVKPSAYQKIFDTYPRDSHGREVIYSVLDTGSIQTANDFLKDQYDVPRSKPVAIKQLTWTEDPYNDQYWRFNFYSLRIEKDLLYASLATRDQRYTKKLMDIVNSFIDTGSKQPHAWDDYHAVAWRTMMLTDIWWKLRQQNILPIADSNKILAAIQQHADFLMQPGHYESEFNHGTNEAAALYLTGVGFPDLPGGDKWLMTGKTRLTDTLENLIDDNGALIEHAPYYHFYVLEKYWEIESYALKQHAQIAGFDKKIGSMLNYATYILQPDQHVPLLGASLDRMIHENREYADMAHYSPELAYVLTKGKEGKQPLQNSVQFASTGQTIMRSGWSAKSYTQQTQVIFSYGAYTTLHSHLDALNLQVFGGGIPLLPGPGLYTYDPGAYSDYFTGTSAANTVLVDGKNQQKGSGVAGEFVSKDGYASQSASEQLNSGVTHERQVTLIGDKTVVVIDKLHSDQEHTYQQLFHLFPGATYSHEGLTAVAQGAKPQQRLQIKQLMPDGIALSDAYNQTDPAHLAGVCSLQYEKLVPCRQLAYTQKGKDATFVTVLAIGKDNTGIRYTLSGKDTVQVVQNGKTYHIAVREQKGVEQSVSASDPTPTIPSETVIDTMSDPTDWQVDGGQLSSVAGSYPGGTQALQLTSHVGQTATMTKSVNMNLADKNILFRLNIPDVTGIEGPDLRLYSGDAYAQLHLLDPYGTAHAGQWLPISLAKGAARDQQGQWEVTGTGFDWSKITALQLRVRGKSASATVMLGTFSTYQQQATGNVVIVFDDGYASIKPAAEVINKLGFKANVAVIGKYPDRKQSGYLSIADLKTLKNQGWSLINHSYDHQDAVARYYSSGNLKDYEQDVLAGATFLAKNDLSTDENWYIDPHGVSNTTTEAVVGKYYKFIRTTLKGPEAYPFGDPKVVKAFSVQDNTPVVSVKKAIDDANAYHQTLFLTFHRVHSTPTDKGGYDIGQFTEIMNYLKSTNSSVMSLNQLDAANGVPMNHLRIQQGYPSRIQSTVTVTSPSWFDRIKKWF